MSTTLQFPADHLPGKTFDGPISLTYSGADPADDGPAGAVIRMLIAQASGDREALAREVTPQTMEMSKSEPPGQNLSVDLQPPVYEGEDQSTAIVAANASADGNQQSLPIVVTKQDGKWLVDMNATVDRLMGGAMDQIGNAMQSAMEGMASAMGQAMQGLADGMSKSFNQPELDHIPDDPDDSKDDHPSR